MKARVHGYPQHYHREAHLNIGAVRRLHHHTPSLCVPEMLQIWSRTTFEPLERKAGVTWVQREAVSSQWM